MLFPSSGISRTIPLVVLLLLSACKIVTPVSEGGQVISDSGAYDCAAGETCKINVVDTFFDETFTAEPGEGQVFLGWQKGEGWLCGGNKDSCHLSTVDFAGNKALEDLLTTDTEFYLEPVFAVEGGPDYQLRYCEVLVFTETDSGYEADVWNSQGVSDCQEEQVRALDGEVIAQEMGAAWAWVNGPRFWLRDDRELKGFPPGFVGLQDIRRDFGGIELRLVTSVEIPGANLDESAGYNIGLVSRDTVWIYRAGRRVYELENPDGARYLMQSFSTEVNPRLDITELRYLGESLKLPDGWQFRSYILEEELRLPTVNGIAEMVTDDFSNAYQRIPE
jgi:haloalkane dehalogenase